MEYKRWAALCALLAALPVAHAGQRAARPDPADPNVAVPAPAYDSALKDYAPAVKDGAPAPDRAWRAANDAVGGQDPHAGHHAPAPQQASVPAQPAPRRAEPAAASGDHHKHH
ncbi:MAG: hypothetical protein AB1584_09410 [Pseudomonadota bacterium]